MEHITIKELGDNRVRLKGEKGYKVYDKQTGRKFSEVECDKSELNRYCAIAK